LLPPSFWQALGVAGVSRYLAQSIVGTLRQDPTLNPLATLRAWPNLPAEALRRLNQADLGLADRALEQGGWIWEPADYPESLREMESPPLCLFGRGSVEALHEPMVAIVGTRKASSYGLAVAEFFGKGLAEQGYTVLSGGALGIDAQAHKGALAGGGRTVAVMGTGPDVAYPAVHKGMFAQMEATGGARVSPFPFGTPSFPSNFPARNPLIAGLAQAVVLVEAPAQSGALQTVAAALDLGRDVFVVPGPITSPAFRGSHGLIRDGATLVEHPMQVVEALGGGMIQPLPPEEGDDLSETQQAILACLNGGPMLTEAIVRQTGLSAPLVLAELTMMELDGIVKKGRDGYQRGL